MNFQEGRLKSPVGLVLTGHPLVKAFLAGSFSGTCSTFLFQPLDLLKTRVQQAEARHLTMRAAASSILHTDSVSGLWRGLAPSLARTVPGVGLYFASMHGLKTALCGGQAPTSSQSMLIGGAARTLAGLLTIPVTVVKIRYESGQFGYRSTLQALRVIFRAEGLTGLTSGLLPTLVRDVPFSGIYLMFYERLKRLAKHMQPQVFGGFSNKNQLDSLVHFGCGLTAGVLASLVTQPADVVKTRQQLATGSNINNNTLWAVTLRLAREEGPTAFFRGSVPRMMRRTLMAALAWTVYEKAMKNIGIK